MKKCGGGRCECELLSLASGNSRDRVKSHHVSAPLRVSLMVLGLILWISNFVSGS